MSPVVLVIGVLSKAITQEVADNKRATAKDPIILFKLNLYVFILFIYLKLKI